jgi:hypothetical protein
VNPGSDARTGHVEKLFSYSMSFLVKNPQSIHQKIVIQSHLSHLVKTSSIKKHQTRRKAILLAHSHLSHVQNPPHLPSAAQSILEGHSIHPNLGSTAEWCLTH